MGELRKPNGDYTEEGLKYPGMKADIDLCYKYLHELCQIVWGCGRSEDGYRPKMTMWSIPPQPDNFDMQISAALDELKAYRNTGLMPTEASEQIKIEFENGSSIESLPYNKNVRGKRAELNPLLFDYKKADMESVNEVLKEYFQPQKEEINNNGMR